MEPENPPEDNAMNPAMMPHLLTLGSLLRTRMAAAGEYPAYPWLTGFLEEELQSMFRMVESEVDAITGYLEGG